MNRYDEFHRDDVAAQVREIKRMAGKRDHRLLVMAGHGCFISRESDAFITLSSLNYAAIETMARRARFATDAEILAWFHRTLESIETTGGYIPFEEER